MTVPATTIAEALDDSETGVDVADVLGFPASGAYTVRVDSEWMRVTAGAATTTWTVTRGYNSTTAAIHSNGAAIYLVPDTYPDLSRIKRRLRGGEDTETTVDDDILTDFIGAVQSDMVSRLGMFLGPTTQTVITLDGRDAMRNGMKLAVPFGIQSLTTLEVAPYTGASFETVTTADVILGPRVWETRLDENQPYTWLRFKDVVTGSHSRFPEGDENVRITGALGWTEPPSRLGEIADTTVIRMFHARNTGQRDMVGNDSEGYPIISRFMSPADKVVLQRFWAAISAHKYV